MAIDKPLVMLVLCLLYPGGVHCEGNETGNAL